MPGHARTVEVERLAAAFSTTVLRGLAHDDPSEALPRVKHLESLEDVTPDTSLGDAFDKAFTRLRDEYRNEYFFKSHLVGKIVFGRHSPRTASALLEVPMGRSCADLVILNGTSSIYEVKTDMDDFTRLAGQLESYTTRADRVSVVVSESRALAAERHLPSSIGVLAVRPLGALWTVRASASHLHQVQVDHLFQLLRTREAAAIVERTLHVDCSGMATGRAWPFLREQFATLSVEEAHREVVTELRRRGMRASALVESDVFPKSLRCLAYATDLSRRGRQRLLERMDTPLSQLG